MPLPERFFVLATGGTNCNAWGRLATRPTTTQLQNLRKCRGPVLQTSAAVEHALNGGRSGTQSLRRYRLVTYREPAFSRRYVSVSHGHLFESASTFSHA